MYNIFILDKLYLHHFTRKSNSLNPICSHIAVGMACEIDFKNRSYLYNYYNDLISQNHTENDSYLIYINKDSLREYARNELDYMLDMEYHLDRLLDKDILIDIFLNNTTK